MNRKQRKAKQQRANQHRKQAKYGFWRESNSYWSFCGSYR